MLQVGEQSPTTLTTGDAMNVSAPTIKAEPGSRWRYKIGRHRDGVVIVEKETDTKVWFRPDPRVKAGGQKDQKSRPLDRFVFYTLLEPYTQADRADAFGIIRQPDLPPVPQVDPAVKARTEAWLASQAAQKEQEMLTTTNSAIIEQKFSDGEPEPAPGPEPVVSIGATATHKQCRRCHNWKTAVEFGPHKRYQDGLQPWCKQCQREYNGATVKIHPDSKRIAQAVPAGFKQCSVCKNIQPRQDFHLNRSAKDGLAYKCKACTAAYDALKAKRAKSPFFAKPTPDAIPEAATAPPANPVPEPDSAVVSEEKPSETRPTQPETVPGVLSADVATREWRVKLRRIVVTVDEVTITAATPLDVLAAAEAMTGEVVGMQLLEAGV